MSYNRVLSMYGSTGKGKPLSPYEKQYIERRLGEQAFIRQIARELGRSLEPVKQYAHKLREAN